MAERTGVSEKPEPIVISPTPLEAQFDSVIKERFKTALTPPFINSEYDLVRGSIPVVVGDKAVIFQYRRFDIARTYLDQVLQAFNQTYPNIDYPKTRDFRDDHADTPWEDIYVLANFGHSKIKINMLVLEEIRQRIESQGGYDAREALGNPNYYIPGKSIIQFPEIFEVAIFNDVGSINNSEPAILTGRHGKVEDQRPDVYVTLKIGPRFVDYTPIYTDKSDYPPDYDDHLVIHFPKMELLAYTAFVSAYRSYNKNLGRENGLELDDISFFPHSSPLSYRSRSSELNDPRLVMSQLGTLVDGFARVSN